MDGWQVGLIVAGLVYVALLVGLCAYSKPRRPPVIRQKPQPDSRLYSMKDWK